jgi:hypothetical protein
VRCVAFATGAWTAEDPLSSEVALDVVYTAWVEGPGFPERRLTRRVEIDSWIPLQVRVGPYEYGLREFTQSGYQNTNGRGRCLRSSKVASTCCDASESAPRHRTTRPEFFHALQHGYPEHLDNRSSIPNAVAGGTARPAETSQTGLQRSPRNLLGIDSRLFTTGGAIGADSLAQGFWIYLGFRFVMGLEYLQAIDIGGGVLGDRCTLNTVVATPRRRLVRRRRAAGARHGDPRPDHLDARRDRLRCSRRRRIRRRDRRGVLVAGRHPRQAPRGRRRNERVSIDFRAEVSGSPTTPGDVTVPWSYERLVGVPFRFGATELRETSRRHRSATAHGR